LRELGWAEGKSIEIEFRWADTVDRLPSLAAEFVDVPWFLQQRADEVIE
jgi:hypothetical protein